MTVVYIPGKGTLIKYKTGGSYATIGQVTKISPPSEEMGTVETTLITDAARTFLATILDSGEVTLTVQWNPADTSHAALLTAKNAGTLLDLEILFTQATTIQFFGVITKWPIDEIDVEGVVTLPITLKLSGAVTVTP